MHKRDELSTPALDGPTCRAAILVFCCGLVVRLWVSAVTYATPISDFAGYRTLAEDWLATGGFGHGGSLAYRTPAYPGFLALTFRAAGPSPEAVAVVQAVMGAVTSALVVLLAGAMLGVVGSTIAGLMHALSPTAVGYVPLLASENLASLLIVGALLLLAVSRENSPRYLLACASAALYGLLLLVRPAALFALPAFAFVSAYSPSRRIWLPRRLGAFLLVIGVTLTPWLARNQRMGLGFPVLSTNSGMNLWMGNNDRARTGGWRPAALDRQHLGEAERNRAYLSAAADWIRCHPRDYLRMCARRAWRLFGTEPDAMLARQFLTTYGDDLAVVGQYRANRGGPPLSPDTATRARLVQEHNLAFLWAVRCVVSPLVLIGLLWSARQWRRYSLVVLPALSYLVGLSITYAEPRFRELSDPLLIVPVAGLLQTRWYRISTGSYRPPAKPHQPAEGGVLNSD